MDTDPWQFGWIFQSHCVEVGLPPLIRHVMDLERQELDDLKRTAESKWPGRFTLFQTEFGLSRVTDNYGWSHQTE